MQADLSQSISHVHELKEKLIVTKKTTKDFYVSNTFWTLGKHRSQSKTEIDNRYFIVQHVPDTDNYCGI
jgi:hypothetical protein